MGTALNKILKDIVTRFHQMKAKTQYMYLAGIVMDLPIEWKIEEQYKKKKKIKMKYPLKTLDKNAENLQKNGLRFILKNLKDWV